MLAGQIEPLLGGKRVLNLRRRQRLGGWRMRGGAGEGGSGKRQQDRQPGVSERFEVDYHECVTKGRR